MRGLMASGVCPDYRLLKAETAEIDVNDWKTSGDRSMALTITYYRIQI